MSEWFWIILAAIVLTAVFVISLRAHLFSKFGSYDTVVDGIVTGIEHGGTIGNSIFNRQTATNITYKYEYMGKEYEGCETLYSTSRGGDYRHFVKKGDPIKVKLRSHNPKESTYRRPIFTPKLILRIALTVAIIFLIAYLTGYRQHY